jgi:hypothetical protein
METLISIDQLEELVKNVIEQTAETEVKQHLSSMDFDAVGTSIAEDFIKSNIQTQLDTYNLRDLIKRIMGELVAEQLGRLEFPDHSIPSSAIIFENLQLSGNQIKGGVHQNFTSTGIQDTSTAHQLTVMDNYVVVESELVTNTANVKRDLIIDGNLILKGDVNTESRGIQRLITQAADLARESLSGEILDKFASATTDKFSEQGIDASKLTINGKDAIVENSLGKHITESNLQKLGTINELQTRGEVDLSDVLYVGNKRVGINTWEPSRALAVWDEETEIVAGKHSKNTSYIGSIRNQRVILGSDNETNIILDTDGSTKVTDLTVDGIRITSSDTVPGRTGTLGEIVFNANPAVGAPMGWVCLGETRWASLGRIES